MSAFLYFVNYEAHAVASLSGEKKPQFIALLEAGGFSQCDHVEFLKLRLDTWYDGEDNPTVIDIEGDEKKKRKGKSK